MTPQERQATLQKIDQEMKEILGTKDVYSPSTLITIVPVKSYHTDLVQKLVNSFPSGQNGTQTKEYIKNFQDKLSERRRSLTNELVGIHARRDELLSERNSDGALTAQAQRDLEALTKAEKALKQMESVLKDVQSQLNTEKEKLGIKELDGLWEKQIADIHAVSEKLIKHQPVQPEELEKAIARVHNLKTNRNKPQTQSSVSESVLNQFDDCERIFTRALHRTKSAQALGALDRAQQRIEGKSHLPELKS